MRHAVVFKKIIFQAQDAGIPHFGAPKIGIAQKEILFGQAKMELSIHITHLIHTDVYEWAVSSKCGAIFASFHDS